MVHKNQHITLTVSGSISEAPGCKSVFFERPAGFVFEAGDWIDINPMAGALAGGKTYSLSSSPTESDLRITFREGVSELKRALQSIQPGEKLYISQYGNDYGFQLKQHKSSVLIAGGIGIAPFRSMLKELADSSSKSDVRLLYLHQSSDFLFRSELDMWQLQLPNLVIHYIETKQLNRKKREKHLLSLVGDPSSSFYISGPPAMVEHTEHLLIDNGVPIRNIRIDSFGGY